MLNWRKWCRLCGDFEVSDKVEPEIAAIAEQVFDVIYLIFFFVSILVGMHSYSLLVCRFLQQQASSV